LNVKEVFIHLPVLFEVVVIFNQLLLDELNATLFGRWYFAASGQDNGDATSGFEASELDRIGEEVYEYLIYQHEQGSFQVEIHVKQRRSRYLVCWQKECTLE
tara:strand:+ start:16047 stop:16352 length:306 start_codon:yes stop_codon:yes gene_type:complete